MFSNFRNFWAWPVAMAIAFSPALQAAVEAEGESETVRVMMKPSEQEAKQTREEIQGVKELWEELGTQWQVYAEPIEKDGEIVGYEVWLGEELFSDRGYNKDDIPQAMKLIVFQNQKDKELAAEIFSLISLHARAFMPQDKEGKATWKPDSTQELILDWGLEHLLGSNLLLVKRDDAAQMREFLFKNPAFVEALSKAGGTITYTRYGQPVLVTPDNKWGWKGFRERFVDENNYLKPEFEFDKNQGLVEVEVTAEENPVDPMAYFDVGTLADPGQDTVDDPDVVAEGSDDEDQTDPLDNFTRKEREQVGLYLGSDPSIVNDTFGVNLFSDECTEAGNLPKDIIAKEGCVLFLYTPWKRVGHKSIGVIDSVDTLRAFVEDFQSGDYKPNLVDVVWFNEWEKLAGEWYTPEGNPTNRKVDFALLPDFVRDRIRNWFNEYTPQDMFEGYSISYYTLSAPGHTYIFSKKAIEDDAGWNNQEDIDNIDDWNAMVEDIYQRKFRLTPEQYQSARELNSHGENTKEESEDNADNVSSQSPNPDFETKDSQ